MKQWMLAGILSVMLAGAAFGAPAVRDYQVTGSVIELTDKIIVVQKGDERWELARTPTTKVDGALKAGTKVTIHYSMTAKSVEVKEK
jgi:hypothetical protein